MRLKDGDMNRGWIKQMDEWYDLRDAGELRKDYHSLRYLYEQVVSRINKLDDDTKEMKASKIPMRFVDTFLEDITKILGE